MNVRGLVSSQKVYMYGGSVVLEYMIMRELG